MITLNATARFFAEAMRGPVPTPTRSFVLGDPSRDEKVYGCIIDTPGHQVIEPGTCGPVEVRLVADEWPDRSEPVPIWAGRVLGELTGITLSAPPPPEHRQ
jgi:hypothetical protein